METTASPVAIVADPAALIAQLAVIAQIDADCRAQLVKDGVTPGRIAGLARTSEAASAAAGALFHLCSTLSIYLEEKPVRVALDNYLAAKSEAVYGRG